MPHWFGNKSENVPIKLFGLFTVCVCRNHTELGTSKVTNIINPVAAQTPVTNSVSKLIA